MTQISCLSDESPSVSQMLKQFHDDIDHGVAQCALGNIEEITEIYFNSSMRNYINYPNQLGMTPLNTAVSNGCYPVVKKLLTHPDIDINRQNPDGTTPIMEAMIMGRMAIFMLLTEDPRIDWDITQEDHRTIQELAFDNDQTEFIKFFIKKDDLDYDIIVKSDLDDDSNDTENHFYEPDYLDYDRNYDHDNDMNNYTDRDYKYDCRNNMGFDPLQ